MRLSLALLLATGALLAPLAAQECPAVARLAPAGSVSGTLAPGGCALTGGSLYSAYRLDLPVRGRIAIDLGGTAANLQLILRGDSGAALDSGGAIHRAIEAGSYRLLVAGQTPRDAGAFTLTTAFTAEPSMLCADYPAMGLRQTISNTLGSYGCTAPDGTPYDAWSLTTYGSGTLTATIASADFTPTLTLRGSDGRLLATDAGGTLTAALTAGSQYILVAASADRGGTYQIAATFEDAPDDPCHALRTLADGDSDNGTITAGGCAYTLPDSGDQLNYNYYNFTLSAPAVASFTAVSGDFNPTLYVLDEAGNTLAADTLGGGWDASGRPQSSLAVPLPPGNYLLQVFSDVPAGGAYQLQAAITAGPFAPCVPAAANPGDSPSGALSAASCRTALGLSDFYAVTLPASGTLDLALASPTFPAILAIRDAADNVIVRSPPGGVAAAHISADLPAGAYTLAATAGSASGAYTLTTKFTAHDVPPCAFAQTLDLNGGYIQRLGAGSCRGANGEPVDYYSFTLAADSFVLGVVTSSEVDGYLTLLDAAGNALRMDDNGYGGIDPLIVQYLPAASYRFAVRDAAASAGGLYEIDLRTVEGPRPPFCGARGTLSPGSSVSGTITYTGCQYTDQTFADIYQVTVPADSTLDLRLNSGDFDAYLVLVDAKGNVVAEDDNSGGGTNARITTPVAAGTYYVAAKPSGDYLSNGAYTLAADATPGTGSGTSSGTGQPQ